jgi:chemotaxis protein MotB
MKMNLRIMGMMFMALSLMTSCVSKKKFTKLKTDYDALDATYRSMETTLNGCQGENTDLKQKIDGKNKQIGQLQDEVDYLKKNNNMMITQLENLSIISKTGAESMKKSLDILNEQSRYIKDLNQLNQRKDSLNLALVTNLKRSLENINDQDVEVEVRGGVVYVSISDMLLFKSGSSEINAAANNVLAKIAKIILDHKDLNVMVEGHTDDVPISTECVKDNWDLSVKRATSVVRYLEGTHKIGPERLTAAGRGEYAPKIDNKNSTTRKQNRRTEIVLTPRLDQYIELSVPKQ